MDRIVGNHFRLRRRIGAGSFGEIYSAENTRSRRRVAVKLESVRTRVPQLSYESKLYAIFSGGTGIPRLHWYGTEDSHNIMVIDLLGKSLEDLFVYCHHKFTLKTVLMLVDQMISCVEFIHNKNFIHRDIKPDNFVMGLGSASTQVFVIDYGLSKKYRDQHTHVHIPYVEGKSLTGTARYASVGALKGVEQSRRDDMESLGYVWLYLLRGSLPWMGLNGRDQKQKYDRIRDVKCKTPFEELCSGYPEEFVKFFNDVRNLKFTDKPHYAEYRQMFRDLFLREGYLYDYKYDWCRDSPRPVPPRPVSSTPKVPTPEPALASKQPASQFPNKKATIQISGQDNDSNPIALVSISKDNRNEGIPSSTMANVRSEPVLNIDDDNNNNIKNSNSNFNNQTNSSSRENSSKNRKTDNKEPKTARRNSKRDDSDPIKQPTANKTSRPPPQSALVMRGGDNTDKNDKNPQTNRVSTTATATANATNTANANNTNATTKHRSSKLAGERQPDSARRTSGSNRLTTNELGGYGKPPPQSALAGGGRRVSGGGGGDGGMRMSARRDLAPTPRAVAPKKKATGAAQPDNSIRRTLMPHWMEEPKAKRTTTTTHTNRKTIYHI